MFGPLVAKPKKTKETGSWRSLKKPKFLHDNCVGCSLCKMVCPEVCIEGNRREMHYVDYEYCKGCGLCADICPKDDITMVDEEEAQVNPQN